MTGRTESETIARRGAHALPKEFRPDGDFAFRSYGLRIGIRTDRSDVLARIIPHLPPGWERVSAARVERLYVLESRAPSPNAGHVLSVNARRILQAEDLDDAIAVLALDLRLYIAEHARDRIFVHAGVVGWRGRAIVIPGHSSSGKTTLVHALVRCGATYYSDEYAVFDRRGRVHPFPTPLFLLRDGHKRHVPIEALGGSAGATPLPVGLVVITAYDPARRWRPRRLSPGEALLELLAHTVPARRRPASALAALSRAVAQALVLKGKRGEAEPTAREILDRCTPWEET